MYKPYEQYLSILRTNARYRRLTPQRQAKSISLLDFSTNDYLNLTADPYLLHKLKQITKQYKIGSTGSRLLSGNINIHQQLEKKIANDNNTEAAITFSSGFIANLSSLAALTDPQILGSKALLFFDKLNHASLYQAAFLSGARLCRYQHNNLDHLEKLLKQYETDKSAKFIVTESIFSMDGDIVDLSNIVTLAEKYNCMIYIDEAHATGLFGKNGYGLSTLIDFKKVPHIIMGTFSKALGISGGYIACDQIIADYLINKAQGFIYSTAPSPIITALALESWNYVTNLQERRDNLQANGKILRNMLKNAGFNTGLSQTHIIPIILYDEKSAILMQEKLAKKNILVSCIRPPTVPPNAARLRISLTSNHTIDDLNYLIEQLKALS
ncbi:aminotransferase class I/II-fold pyridoxal phosphate-dependent enzyme [Bartonella sp. DGB1]|uniref:aminotransferase class I/II-fold pyridoxal phosphate-dependent enzyme n=1 Tax=Bartonella sp. DGB1 TaxID=3239807 RepID=UPI0035232F96